MRGAGLLLLLLLLLGCAAPSASAGNIFTRNPHLEGYNLKQTKRVATKVNRDLCMKDRKQQTPANLMDEIELIQSGAKEGKVKELFLESGLSVLLMEKRDFPTVTTQVWHKIGSHDEEPEVNGISHLLEHLLFKGTKSRPAQFMRLFYILGAEANAFTNYDVTVYYETTESDKLYHLLTLEADRLVNANLEAEQVLSERDVVISELMGFEGRPSYRLNRFLMGHVYGTGSGYGLPIGGLPSDVETMTVEQVQAHYNKFYGPDHATLVVVGDFDSAQAIDWIHELFGAESTNYTRPEVTTMGGNYSSAPPSEYQGGGEGEGAPADDGYGDSAPATTTTYDDAPATGAITGTPEMQHMVLLYLMLAGMLGPVNPMFAVAMQQFLLFWFGTYLGYNVGVPVGDTLFGGAGSEPAPPAEPDQMEPEPTPAEVPLEEVYDTNATDTNSTGPPADPGVDEAEADTNAADTNSTDPPADPGVEEVEPEPETLQNTGSKAKKDQQAESAPKKSLPAAILNNPWLNIPGGAPPIGPMGMGGSAAPATGTGGSAPGPPSAEDIISRMRSILGGAGAFSPGQPPKFGKLRMPMPLPVTGAAPAASDASEIEELENEIRMLKQEMGSIAKTASAQADSDPSKMLLAQSLDTLTRPLKLTATPPVKPTVAAVAAASTAAAPPAKQPVGSNVEVKGAVLNKKLAPTVDHAEAAKQEVARRLERVLQGGSAPPAAAFDTLRQQIEQQMHRHKGAAAQTAEEPAVNTNALAHEAAMKMKQALFPGSAAAAKATTPMEKIAQRLQHADPARLQRIAQLMAKAETGPNSWHRHGNGLNAFLETESQTEEGRMKFSSKEGGLHLALARQPHLQSGSAPPPSPQNAEKQQQQQQDPTTATIAASHKSGHGFTDPSASSSYGTPQNGWYFPGWFGNGGFGSTASAGAGSAPSMSGGSQPAAANSKFRISDSEPVTLKEEGMMDALIVQVVFPMSSMTFENLDRSTFEAFDLVLTSGHSSILSEALDKRGVQWSQVSSEFTANADSGWYSITLVVGGHGDVPLVQASLGDVIAKLREEAVEQEALEVAKTNLRVRALFASDEPADIAQTLGEDYLLAKDYDFTAKYESQTNLITTEAIRDAVKKYFVEGNAKVGIYENYIPEEPSPQFLKVYNKLARRNAIKSPVRLLPLKHHPTKHTKPNQYHPGAELERVGARPRNYFAHGARWGFTTDLPQLDLAHGTRGRAVSASAQAASAVDTLHNRRRFSELDFSDLLAVNAATRDPNEQTNGYLDINRDLSFLPTLPVLEDHKPVSINAGEKLVLDNGMEVLLLPEDSGLVRISGRVLAGAVYDGSDKAGISAITATLLMQQTQHYTYADFVMNLEEDVSDLSFQPGRESVSISGFAVPEHFERVLQIVQEALVYPDFQEQDVSDLGEALAQSVGPESQSAEEYARQRLQSAIFPDKHAFHSFPTTDSYRNIKHKDVTSFFDQHYGPKTTRLVITGHFDMAEMKDTVKEMFADWKSDAQVQIEEEPPVASSGPVVKERQQVDGTADLITVIGKDGVARCADNFYVAQVASQILGGDTLSARLGTHVRDQKGLTYGVYSSYESGMHAGMFLIHMQTAPDKTEEAVSEIYHVLDDWVKDGVNDLEVEVAKRNLISQQTMSLSDPSSIGSFLVTADLCGITDPVEAVNSAHSKLLAVTTEQVNAHIKEFMDPSTMHEVIAGAVEDIV